MKVGDLVVLSSYGLARNYNSRLGLDETGIIVKIRENSTYPFKVVWSKLNKTAKPYFGHMRRELKYAYR